MSVRYSREELSHIIATRHGADEGTGDGAFLEFRVKVTPELLQSILGGVWLPGEGAKPIAGVFGRVRLEAVSIDDDGYLYPEFVAEVPA